MFFSVIPASNSLNIQGGITVVLKNFRNNKGHVLVSLFNSSKGFPDKANQAIRKVQVNINNKTATISFTDLPEGQYAIAILHDENDDQKMNTNFWGIPTEGYGFSNNVMGTFGPPSFSRASFQYTGSSSSLQVDIRVKYGI